MASEPFRRDRHVLVGGALLCVLLAGSCGLLVWLTLTSREALELGLADAVDGFWKYAADWLPEVLDELDGRDVNEDRLMQAAQALARRALEQGSDDNVSIALLRCGDSTVKPLPRRVTVETTQQEEAS